jgi:competence protein ComEA
MKITISSVSENKNVTVAVAEIESAKRLALSMPIDINLATESDLILVNGIGEVTAKKILDMRSKLGRYKNIEQLTEIKGIKEKKLAKIRKYLYVEK